MTESKPTIQIFRHGNAIAEMPNKETLRQWLIDNVPYNADGEPMPRNTTLTECLEIARKRGYSFSEAEATSVAFEAVSRLGRILSEVDIVEVAADLGFPPTKRGKNYICKCPRCKSDTMVALIPSKGVYRCFVCGETGNAINFVKSVRRMSTDEAVNYLESKYINK